MSKHAHPLASQRIPAVLAPEVEADPQTWFAKEPAAIDPADGGRERDLGRGTHRQRIAMETRDPSFPRTVEKYLHVGGPVRTPDPQQRWLTFVRNHANVIVACDFFTVVTATFRTLYVFVILEIATRRMIHKNVTAHPTAEWILQQFREVLPGGHGYRYVIHDRDSITVDIHVCSVAFQ